MKFKNLQFGHRYNTRMSIASGSNETKCLGVQLTEGLGNLPKVVLTSSHGRYHFSPTNSYIVCVHRCFFEIAFWLFGADSFAMCYFSHLFLEIR